LEKFKGGFEVDFEGKIWKNLAVLMWKKRNTEGAYLECAFQLEHSPNITNT